MAQSIKDFVKESDTNRQMTEDLVALLGVDTVSQLPPQFIEFICNLRKNIDKDLKELTLSEGIEYLTMLLVSYLTEMHFKLKEIAKK